MSESQDKSTTRINDTIKVDWTVDPSSNRSNSSTEFARLAQRVGQIIKSSAHDLIRGRANEVGHLIMAQLAHVEGLGPVSATVQSLQNQPSGHLSGTFEYGERVFAFTATPLYEASVSLEERQT